jgi:hypothetical protein
MNKYLIKASVTTGIEIEVEANNEWHSTSMAMAKYPNKLSGQLIMYRVKDENGNLLIKQF